MLVPDGKLRIQNVKRIGMEMEGLTKPTGMMKKQKS